MLADDGECRSIRDSFCFFTQTRLTSFFSILYIYCDWGDSLGLSGVCAAALRGNGANVEH